MKTKILTLALTAIFGLGLMNAQEVKKAKQEPTKKEAKATKKAEKKATKKADVAPKAEKKAAKAK